MAENIGEAPVAVLVRGDGIPGKEKCVADQAAQMTQPVPDAGSACTFVTAASTARSVCRSLAGSHETPVRRRILTQFAFQSVAETSEKELSVQWIHISLSFRFILP